MQPESLTGWLAILAAAACLAACGDGTIKLTDKVHDASDTEKPANEDPLGPIYVEITSHEDEQVITGSRTISLAGTVTGASEITAATITATLNDGDPVVVDVEEGAFSVDLTLGDRENVIEVLADYQGETHKASLSLNYPFLAFANGQDAALVIGQPDFESSGSGLSATRMDGPWGISLSDNGTLYISDASNNRILGYEGVPTANGAAADFVLGQPDFISGDPALTQGRLSSPRSISIQGETMAVADRGNNRVLIYHGLPTTTGAEPDVVLGQLDFTANACEWAGVGDSLSVWLANDKLFVADYNSHRVLIWNDIPTENGVTADLVLGQETFDGCDGSTSASGLGFPNSVWSDGERVVVTDGGNDRVLIWNTFPTSNGQAADVVLGQEDMDTGTSSGISASSFEMLSSVTSNGNQLFVGECRDPLSRILIWDEFPKENNVPADHVLGSSDFEEAGFECVGTMQIHDDRLIISESMNDRVLIFEAP